MNTIRSFILAIEEIKLFLFASSHIKVIQQLCGRLYLYHLNVYKFKPDEFQTENTQNRIYLDTCFLPGESLAIKSTYLLTFMKKL